MVMQQSRPRVAGESEYLYIVVAYLLDRWDSETKQRLTVQ